MGIKEGKKYINEAGWIVGPLIKQGNPLYPFYDPEHETTFTEGGKAVAGRTSMFDIVHEYQEGDMHIETGKRYVRRDGNISGVIIQSLSKGWPFHDGENVISYTANGFRFGREDRDNADLIAEYIGDYKEI